MRDHLGEDAGTETRLITRQMGQELKNELGAEFLAQPFGFNPQMLNKFYQQELIPKQPFGGKTIVQ